jgi:hypothetical protein
MDELELRLRGEPYRSEGERQLARFFGNYKIRFVYEDPVLVTDRGKQKIWYPDFHLPDFAAYVEYFGLTGKADYDQGTARKMAAFHASGLAVVPVYPWNMGAGLEGYMAASLAEIQRSRSARPSRISTCCRVTSSINTRRDCACRWCACRRRLRLCRAG